MNSFIYINKRPIHKTLNADIQKEVNSILREISPKKLKLFLYLNITVSNDTVDCSIEINKLI
jgi:DNA mismatch repair ATPase MutL